MALPPIRSSHLGAALSWSAEGAPTPRTVAAAAVGVAVPVIVGLLTDQAETGYTIGLGALLLGGETPSASGVTQAAPHPAAAILPAALAVSSATAIAGAAWADAVMIALVGAAATISGYSRPVGVAAIRFIIYLVLSVTLLDGAGEHRAYAALVFGLGAVWNIFIRVLLAKRHSADPPIGRQPTPAQRRAHWRRTLQTVSGWQFPIRIVAGLSIASVLRHLWPTHHYAWIVLTVALLTQRPLEHLPVKTTQRALGTALGVALTWFILTAAPPAPALGLLICILGVAAAIFRMGNYLGYAVASTPVILLVVDFGKSPETGLLVDRLVATAIGAAIVVGLNVLLNRIQVSGPESPGR